MTEAQGFRGLRVAAFESRMAEEMARLIARYGGEPLVAPSMREIPLENNTEALEFGEHLLAGRFDMVILLTGSAPARWSGCSRPVIRWTPLRRHSAA